MWLWLKSIILFFLLIYLLSLGPCYMILLNALYSYLTSCLMEYKFVPDWKNFAFQGQNLLHLQPNRDFVLCELYMPMSMLNEFVSSLQVVAACFYEDDTMLDVSLLVTNYVVTSNCVVSLPELWSLNVTCTTLTSLFLYLVCLTVPTKPLTCLLSMSIFEVNMSCAPIFNFN